MVLCVVVKRSCFICQPVFGLLPASTFVLPPSCPAIDEEHLAACLHPFHHRDAHQQPLAHTARPPLQHSATAVSHARPLSSNTATVGGGRQHGGPFGSLLTPPADAAMLQHSLSVRTATTSEVSGNTQGGSVVGLAPRSSQACPIQDIFLDAGSLLLRPSAPIYCLDLDPAALVSVGSSSSPAAAPLLTQGGSGNRPTVAGVAGLGSRCGYRMDAFGPLGAMSAAVASDAAPPSSPAPGRSPQPAETPQQPGHFWSGSLGSGGSRRGMLTGFNTQLALGPGGMVIGPAGSQSGVGLRPRPKSSHTAAVESISSRQAVLQVGAAGVCGS